MTARNEQSTPTNTLLNKPYNTSKPTANQPTATTPTIHTRKHVEELPLERAGPAATSRETTPEGTVLVDLGM